MKDANFQESARWTPSFSSRSSKSSDLRAFCERPWRRSRKRMCGDARGRIFSDFSSSGLLRLVSCFFLFRFSIFHCSWFQNYRNLVHFFIDMFQKSKIMNMRCYLMMSLHFIWNVWLEYWPSEKIEHFKNPVTLQLSVYRGLLEASMIDSSGCLNSTLLDFIDSLRIYLETVNDSVKIWNILAN